MKLESIDVVSGDYGLTLPLNYPQAELRAIWAHRIVEAGVLEVVWGEPMWRHLVVGIDHRKLLPMTPAEQLLRREDELEGLATSAGAIRHFRKVRDRIEAAEKIVRQADELADTFRKLRETTEQARDVLHAIEDVARGGFKKGD